MEATFAKRDMQNALGLLARVAEAKSTMPVLANVLLKVEGDRMALHATDLYLALVGGIAITKGKSGSFAIPAKELLDRVKNMPDGPLTLVVDDNRATLRGEGKARKFTLRTMPGQDYPPVPVPSADAPSMKISAAVLGGLIDRVFGAISTDETRAHLNSALFEWEGDTLRAVATDGHRLHLTEVKTPGNQGNLTMLIPRKGVAELRRLCDTTDEITISQSGSSAFFIADMTFAVKLVDATFPPYAQVIPKVTTCEVVVSAAAFKDTMRAVAISANARTGGVQVQFAKGSTIIVKASDPEQGESEDSIESETEWTGKPVAIGMNAAYVIAACDAIGDGSMTLGVSGELDPVLVTCGDSKFVIMPLRI